MNKFTKQCVAAVASLAMAGTLCVAGAVVANNVAFAAATSCVASKAPWDETQTTNCVGSITIHKKDNTDASNVKGLNDVEFTIKKVKQIDSSDIFDLKTKDGWVNLAKKVKELNKAILDGNVTTKVNFDDSFGTSGSKVIKTGTSGTELGVAKADSLAIGLYYVEETKAPEGYSPEFTPFFVTVPQITREATATNNTYTYAVSVEPKNRNAKDDVTKDALTGKIVGVGDTLPYVITAKVKLPNDPVKKENSDNFAGSNIKGFKIWDDALKAAYDGIATSDAIAATVKVGEWDSTANKFKDNTTPVDLTKDTHYTLTVADSDVDKENSGTVTRSRILFDFSKGLDKIVEQFGTNTTKDIRVQVTLNLKLNSDYSKNNNSTTLVNKYGFNPGGKAGNTPDIIGNKKSETKFRKFHIFKYDGTTENDTTKKGLGSAKFKAFVDEDKAKKCAADPSGNNCDGNMTGFGEKESSSDSNKLGKTDDYLAKVGEKFYVVETSAPDNFTRSEQVYNVTVPEESRTDRGVYELLIANVPDNKGDFWFHLPKTGATGVTIFAIVGMGLVGIGIFVFMRNRKKDEEHQNA